MMVQFISILLITHLLGDFVFQTSKIAIMKAKSVKGIVIHVAVGGAISVIIMSIFYGLGGFITAIVVAMIHFCIDYMKFKLKSRINKIQTLYFLFDQGLHIIVLLIASSLWGNSLARYQVNTYYSKFIIMSIIGYYVVTILIKNILIDFNLLSKHPFFLKNERYIDGLTALALLYLNLLLGIYGMLTFVLYIGYRYIQKKAFKYSEKICLIKFTTMYLFGIGLVKVFLAI